MMAQLIRFGGVGGMATLAHVAAALAAQHSLPVTAQQANLIGFLTAVLLSYVGHARVTFGAAIGSAAQITRFAILSLIGLATSSLTVWIVTSGLGLGFGIAMAAVAVLVPAATFLAMRFWVFRPSLSGPAWQDIAGAAALALAMAILFWNRSLTNDVDWYLIATREWLAGAPLYDFIMEVNPPLNFYYTVPALLAADLFGLSDTQGQYVVIWVLFFLILTWCSAIIRTEFALSPRKHALLLLGIVAAIILPSLGSIGQREFLLVILMMPWLLRQVPDRPATTGQEVATAAVAALGMCLKPHFVLFPIAVTLARLVRERSLRPILSPANLTFLAIGLAYVGFVALAHPTYLTEVVPMAGLVYGAYDADPFVTPGIALRQTLFLSLPLLIALLDREGRMNPHPFPAVALAGLLAFLMQNKGFGYHMIPYLSFGFMACFLILLNSRRLGSFVIATLVAVIGLTGLSTREGFHRNYSVDHVVQVSKELGTFDSLIALTPHVFAGPPVAVETGAKWASRYPANWLVPGALNRLAKTDCAVETALCARLQAIVDRNRSENIEDMIRHQPDLLIVDRDSDYFDTPRFDWLAFMAEDPAWAAVFAQYRYAGQSNRYQYYYRD